MIATDGGGRPQPLVATPAQEGSARFSPDGRILMLRIPGNTLKHPQIRLIQNSFQDVRRAR